MQREYDSVPGMPWLRARSSRGMAFVLRFITVVGLHGGNCARLDPSPHPHQTAAADAPHLGAYNVYTPGVNVKWLTLSVNTSLTTGRDGDKLQASQNAGGVQFGA